MTNKDKYKRAFAALHASAPNITEVTDMQKAKPFRMRRLVAVCAAVIMILALASIAYATDLGGIQRTIQLWIHGDQTSAVLEIEDGHYSLTYEDADGNVHEQSGGGVAFDVFGNEIPVTEEDIIEQLNMPDVEYRDDGTVWVFYRGQSVEITDKFDEDGVCYVQLTYGRDTLYMTVKYEGGYATSPHSYCSPDSFN